VSTVPGTVAAYQPSGRKPAAETIGGATATFAESCIRQPSMVWAGNCNCANTDAGKSATNTAKQRKAIGLIPPERDSQNKKGSRIIA
jgi:hypothetical protein